MKAWRVLGVLVACGCLSARAAANDEKGSTLQRLPSAQDGVQVTLTQAIETATKQVSGRPYAARLVVSGGKPRYEVDLVAGERLLRIEVDAVTGTVLKSGSAETLPAARRWGFDRAATGRMPPGWLIRQNNPTKQLAKWSVQPDVHAPSRPNVLTVRTGNGNATFNLALAENTSWRDLDLSVKLRADTGTLDQGGGLVWRCRDENNYYICRINPLENNYRLYKVVDGKRQMLASVDFPTPAGRWFTLRATMKDDAIACYCDGRKWLEVKDGTFRNAGMIGLWTKADASCSFDDLVVQPYGGGDEVEAPVGGRGGQKPETKPEK